MGEERNRADNAGRGEEWGPVRRGRGTRSALIRGLSLAGALLGGMIAVGHGPAPGRAWAQDTPAKKQAAPLPAPADEPAPGDAGQEPAPVTAEALSLRYRFLEKYGVTDDPAHPEVITQYRVGIRETQRTEREKPQGAPERSEFSRQTIYTERAAQVGKLGEVVSAVRRYDRFAIKPALTARNAAPPLFDGLTIWFRRQANHKPKVVSLIPDRPIRDLEFSEITKQVIVPQLTVLLPPVPKRVGDSWPISRPAAYSLVSEVPDVDDYELNGTLIEVRKAPSGPGLTAIIGVSGQMKLSLGMSALNTQIHFTFEPATAVASASPTRAVPNAADGAAAKGRDLPAAQIVDARGRITRVLMTWVVTDVQPDSDGRLKQTTTYELNLERRFAPAANEAASATTTALAIPDPLPTADEANSWVVHDDIQGRFHFRHPQSLVLKNRTTDSNLLEFVDENPGAGQDVFLLRLPPGKDEAQADRGFRDPQQFQRETDAYWAQEKVETLRGASKWLPEADWAPLKVYRKELGVKTAGADDGAAGVQRIFIDYYLVLSKGGGCFQVQSMTVRNDHVSFRTQVESMIKSFHFGRWDGKSAAKTAATPELPAAPSTAPR